MKRALITGATGFIGRQLSRHLRETGWLVHAMVLPGSDTSLLKSLCANIRLHECAGDTETIQNILTRAQPDVVFHLASLFLSDHRPTDIEPLIASNLLFGTQVVEAMTQCGVTALVNAGTFWQHYEGRDYSPVNLYAATKQAFESLLQYYVEARGLRIITLKLYDTYGPEDPRPKLINLLRRVATDNQSLTMSPGEQLIDMVHVDDVTAAFRLAGERLIAGIEAGHAHFTVSSGCPISLRDLVGLVEQCLGRALPITWGGRPYREREVMQPWQGPVLPGWVPTISLEAGLAQTLINGKLSQR